MRLTKQLIDVESQRLAVRDRVTHHGCICPVCALCHPVPWTVALALTNRSSLVKGCIVNPCITRD